MRWLDDRRMLTNLLAGFLLVAAAGGAAGVILLRGLFGVRAQLAANAEAVRANAAADQGVALLVGAALLAIALGFFLARHVSSRVALAASALERMAAGDYGQDLGRHSGDEVGDLSRALDQTMQRTSSAVAQIDEATQRYAAETDKLGRTANELTSGSGQLRELLGRFHLISRQVA
jgi:methyl-accepting chemotaxis protein